jgi:hypothetical protein
MDFRDGRWGDSPAEILQRESSADFTPSGNLKEGDQIIILFQNMAIMNFRCDIAYIFAPLSNPALVSGEYRFYDLKNSLKKQLLVTLESKYGQAVELSNDRRVYEIPRSRIILDLKQSRLIHEKK